MARIECDGAAQKVARLDGTARGTFHERQIHERVDVARVGRQRDAEFRRRLRKVTALHQRDAEVVVRLHIPRIDLNRALKLLDRVVRVAVILVQEAEVVVHLRACLVLLEQRAILREGIVEVADALVVERETKVIRRRQASTRWKARTRLQRSPRQRALPSRGVAGADAVQAHSVRRNARPKAESHRWTAQRASV